MGDDLLEKALDTQTVLILFVEIVIIVIYLVSLLLVVMRRAKKLLDLRNRKYYVGVVFYIASKMVLCAILIVQIIVGMASQWSNIDPDKVEMLVKAGIFLADFSIIQLFLVALETYLSHSLSAMTDALTKKRSRMLTLGLKSLQIIVAITLLVPLILFGAGQVSYGVVNGIGIVLNFLVIVSFLITFFYLNIKMTGILLEPRVNEVIKRICKVQLIILVSRACALTFGILVGLYVEPNSFQQEIDTLSQSFKYEVVLACLFLGSVVFILLTEGLPIMYSLRSAVIQALNHKSQYSELDQSILTADRIGLQPSVAEKYENDEFEPATRSYKQIKLCDFANLADVKSQREQSIWISKKGMFEGRLYLIRISKHQISSYIFEDIENQISQWAQANPKSLSKFTYFTQGQILHLVEKFYSINLDSQVSKCQGEKEILKTALQIAEGIEELHELDIPHGCLTPNHIFFQQGQVVFNGMGLHSMKKYLSLVTGYCNKSLYTAVEHLKDRNNIILKPKKCADIYSFGIILYEMVTRNCSYRQLSLQNIQTKFVEQSFRPKIPAEVKIEVKNLIRKCWNEIGQKRPQINEVVESLRRLI